MCPLAYALCLKRLEIPVGGCKHVFQTQSFVGFVELEKIKTITAAA